MCVCVCVCVYVCVCVCVHMCVKQHFHIDGNAFQCSLWFNIPIIHAVHFQLFKLVRTVFHKKHWNTVRTRLIIELVQRLDSQSTGHNYFGFTGWPYVFTLSN